MNQQNIELISFKLCPYVNRSVITLLEKKIDFKITHIDLFDPPEWFYDVSPRKKVPVLKYNNEILFESAAINEFLDEITPGQLMPKDPLKKAQHRAWVEYGSDIIMAQYRMIKDEAQQGFIKNKEQLETYLQYLEKNKQDSHYFDSSEFALIDSAYAPIFIRIDVVKKLSGLDLLDKLPKLSRWSEALLQKKSIADSIIPDFSEVFYDFFKGGYLLKNSID